MTQLTLFLILTAIISYLLGGINGSIIASTSVFKKDVRKFGSGNAGLTNFARTFGSKGVVLVLLVDILKTVAAVLLGTWLIGIAGYPVIGQLFSGFCVMLGHVYPIYYNFKGGKAVLCCAVFCWIVDWRLGLILCGIFFVIVVFTKYVSLGSLVGSVFLPILLWAFGYSGLEVTLGLLSSLLLIFAHRENIKRLINRTEHKLAIGSSAKPSG